MAGENQKQVEQAKRRHYWDQILAEEEAGKQAEDMFVARVMGDAESVSPNDRRVASQILALRRLQSQAGFLIGRRSSVPKSWTRSKSHALNRALEQSRYAADAARRAVRTGTSEDITTAYAKAISAAQRANGMLARIPPDTCVRAHRERSRVPAPRPSSRTRPRGRERCSGPSRRRVTASASSSDDGPAAALALVWDHPAYGPVNHALATFIVEMDS